MPTDPSLLPPHRRLFVPDPDGSYWTVREVPDPRASGSSCLLFENARIARRICSYPSDWALLSVAALLALVGAQ